MTKETFNTLLTQEEFPISAFYDYWNDTKPAEYKSLTLEEFSNLFPKWIASFPPLAALYFKNAVDKVMAYYSKKFNNVK